MWCRRRRREALGDVVRVGLLAGVRLEEVASLDVSQVEPEARWYTIRKGKTESAARVVPLVDAAQAVIKRGWWRTRPARSSPSCA
jgi:integrase